MYTFIYTYIHTHTHTHTHIYIYIYNVDIHTYIKYIYTLKHLKSAPSYRWIAVNVLIDSINDARKICRNNRTEPNDYKILMSLWEDMILLQIADSKY